jgi:predicted nucleic acid-binding protein
MGSLADLRRSLAGCRLLALDTMVFSYHLADSPRYAALTSAVLEAVESGQVAGLITTLTLVPVDVPLAREAALVRACGLRMPDAINVAAARLYGADAMVTNDRRWVGRVATPALLLLDDYLDEG